MMLRPDSQCYAVPPRLKPDRGGACWFAPSHRRTRGMTPVRERRARLSGLPGLGEPLPICCLHGRGVWELVDSLSLHGLSYVLVRNATVSVVCVCGVTRVFL